MKILQGDALETLRGMEAGQVQCCVTSPPYWGLRDYGTAKWTGGSVACDHLRPAAHGYAPFETSTLGPKRDGISGSNSAHADGAKRQQYADCCRKCSAVRVDQQLGLEKTPEEYVTKLVAIFREVRRVLRDDGTLWLNIGDSYFSSPTGSLSGKPSLMIGGRATQVEAANRPSKLVPGCKPKDLVGIPWMLAFALRADGWYLRQEIIWAKPNPMPESVTDRCTKSHESLFLLAKSERYYFDAEAIKEPCVKGYAGSTFHAGKTAEHQLARASTKDREDGALRNKRDVWTVATAPFKGAHFATFPPKLIEPCVLAGSPPGGSVLDPFAGAGTTGVVALRHQRRFVGIELNPQYITMAEKRLLAEIMA